ncbi:amine oxidase [Streptomyces ipomoeae]|uniref:Amine oxidase n=1 Tax=Streptomyces ipomoeae TaxID=103232 RepID=A0AAE9AXT6_9ACTN|nr:NAD(P)/FAD-dependent oxidoreductase [Streptomyces ipomoeae]MDX2693862.1 NAD(P)/FAD-dependent oxidoreductase [Streptomyces ipomoeae]MDX2823500.1 NAD(P)/FAD-dependent oxidoreductase [Streptomyces ipomoeae]MDX2837699.1 NAD(P)/FAD-dependent oxidoreductase [Streptomyces ipomoeae]MDX2873455.1 NAD(P)/FAD-dependent oxidoreductase [Streptomyces ipomoeae]TQE23919.1 amine oxidase [Streptomyces ipomoeae]
MKDVVIVGGGIAGLAAGWRLRHWDTLLLESEGRVGGRIRSERRGPYWLNWGGHVYAGGNSATSWLLNSTGVDSVPVPGSLAGLSMNGKLLLKGRVETYPFRIPMPMSARVGMVKAGAKVALQVARYARIVQRRKGETEAQRQQRIYDFMNDRSFKDFIGDLPEDAEALFKPTVTRSAADIDQLSAGAGVGYFSLVWNIGAGLSQSILGGPSTLTESIAAALSDRVRLNATVDEIVQKNGSVVVRYRHDGVEQEVEARCVVLATPATVSHRIAVDLDRDVREALSKIVYGPYVSAAFLSNETGRQVWDDAYGIATPKRSFNVALNMSNVVHGYERERRPGSSIMTFSPGSLARELLEHDDDTILRTYLDDLDQVLPGFADKVVEAEVQRWPTGAPYCFPGRGKLQQTLIRRSGRVLLAGDYLGTLYTETAIQTGLSAAHEVRSLLATERQTARCGPVSAHAAQ